MHVAFLMRRPRPTGTYSVEVWTQQIIENLSSEFKPTVLVSRFESSGLWRRVYNVLEAAMVRADVYHVPGDVTFLTYLLDHRKTVLTILDCGAISGSRSLRKYLLKLLWYSLPIARSSVVTVISHDVKRQLMHYVKVDPARIRVVPVTVPPAFRPSPKLFDSKRPVILQIGAGRHKNRIRLIQALEGVPCKLVMIGALSVEERHALEERGVAYDNKVNLTEAEMIDAYRDADIVAFPSTYEGFGMPIIEANQIGRPVVTGNVTSMPEVAGDAACLVDPFDVQSIRAGILKVIQDSPYRERLVKNGFRNAQRFEASKVAAMYEDIYRSLISAAREKGRGSPSGRAFGLRRRQTKPHLKETPQVASE